MIVVAIKGWILACDVGTSAAKTALFRFSGDALVIEAHAIESYPTLINQAGEAEQRVDDWWQAICRGTQRCLAMSEVAPNRVEAMIFTAQMQGMVALGSHGRALRNAMIYLDGRAGPLRQKALEVGWPRIQAMNALQVWRSMRITGGIAASSKDPLWKYQWMRVYEPELFAHLDKWLDVKDYLTFRCTHNAMTTYDSAHLTWLYDVRAGREGWSRPLLSTYEVQYDHLPPVVKSGSLAGLLDTDAASELGLPPGIRVYAGAGDVASAAIGSDAIAPGSTHLYIGTSGWIATSVRRPLVDAKHFIAAILGQEPPYFYYVAEQETAGACLDWIRRQQRPELSQEDFYRYLDGAFEGIPELRQPLFAPWLHGNRAPLSDDQARGIFFNLSMTTTSQDMARAVAEGLALHQRWMLDAIRTRVQIREPIRFVGGGARSRGMAQLVADVTNCDLEVMSDPQHVGAMGVARLAAVGLGWVPSLDSFRPEPQYQVHPREEYRGMYEKRYSVFQQLYQQNRRLFHDLQPDQMHDSVTH